MMFRSRIVARSRVFDQRSLLPLFSVLLIVSMLVMPAGAFAAPGVAASALQSNGEKGIFFTSDGLRHDMVESFADQRLMPAMAKLLRTGARAADGGLLTQPPDQQTRQDGRTAVQTM